jgi:hypothetical protein
MGGRLLFHHLLKRVSCRAMAAPRIEVEEIQLHSL